MNLALDYSRLDVLRLLYQWVMMRHTLFRLRTSSTWRTSKGQLAAQSGTGGEKVLSSNTLAAEAAATAVEACGSGHLGCVVLLYCCSTLSFSTCLILSMVTNEHERAAVVVLHAVLDQAPDAGIHLLANHGRQKRMLNPAQALALE